MTIYIGNLSFQASEEDIRDVFAEYGEVTRISLPIDRETGRKRGFAFVDMADDSKEDQAISELDGAEWLGRELRVNKARPRNNNGGGGGGQGRSGNYQSNPPLTFSTPPHWCQVADINLGQVQKWSLS